jgi:hypothetical protein
MHQSANLHDKSTSSPIVESAQECRLNSDPAHQNALRQQINEGDTEAQSESKLEGDEAPSDKKPSGSMESEDAWLKQSKLGDETQSDTQQSSSLERDNTLLKHSSLEAGQPTAKKRPFKQKRKHFTGKHVQISFRCYKFIFP